VFSVVTAVGLFVGSLLTGAPGAWAAAAHFVPEASGATWNGEVVTVTFLEVGVEAGATTTIAVRTTGTVHAVCEKDATVVLSTQSSATATEVSDYSTGPDGTVTATRELALAVRPPIVEGLDCTMRVTRTVAVFLYDLDTGATLSIPGQVTTPTRTPA